MMPSESLVDAFGRVLWALRDGKKYISSNLNYKQHGSMKDLCQRLSAAAASSPDALLDVSQLLELQEVLANPTCFQAALAASAMTAMLAPEHHQEVFVGKIEWSGAAVTSQLAALPGLAPALVRCIRKWPRSPTPRDACCSALSSLCALPLTDCHVPLDELRAAPVDTAAALLTPLSDDKRTVLSGLHNNMFSLLLSVIPAADEQAARRIAAMCAATPAVLKAAVDMILAPALQPSASAAATAAAVSLPATLADAPAAFLTTVACRTGPGDAPTTRPLAATPRLMQAVERVLCSDRASKRAVLACLKFLASVIATHRAASVLSTKEQREGLKRALAGMVRCLNHSDDDVRMQTAWGMWNVLGRNPDPAVVSMLLQLPVLPALVAALRRGGGSGGGGSGGGGGGGGGDNTLNALSELLVITCKTAPVPWVAPMTARLLISAPEALEAVARQLGAAVTAMAKHAPSMDSSKDGAFEVALRAILVLWYSFNTPQCCDLARACRSTSLPQAFGAAVDVMLQLPDLAAGRWCEAVAPSEGLICDAAHAFCCSILCLEYCLTPSEEAPDEVRGACEAVVAACPTLVGRLEDCLMGYVQHLARERRSEEGRPKEGQQQSGEVFTVKCTPDDMLLVMVMACKRVAEQLKGVVPDAVCGEPDNASGGVAVVVVEQPRALEGVSSCCEGMRQMRL